MWFHGLEGPISNPEETGEMNDGEALAERGRQHCPFAVFAEYERSDAPVYHLKWLVGWPIRGG